MNSGGAYDATSTGYGSKKPEKYSVRSYGDYGEKAGTSGIAGNGFVDVSADINKDRAYDADLTYNKSDK